MRMIDGDGLAGRIKEMICKPCIKNGRDYNGVSCRACRYGDEIRDIEDATEVEAVQVIHGHWTREYDCSECGMPAPTDDRVDFIDIVELKFCPYCGAKMDESEWAEEEEED